MNLYLRRLLWLAWFFVDARSGFCGNVALVTSPHPAAVALSCLAWQLMTCLFSNASYLKVTVWHVSAFETVTWTSQSFFDDSEKLIKKKVEIKKGKK